MKRLIKNSILSLSAALLLWSCSKDSEKATFSVRLTDAPADYEAVYVDIKEVHVHTSATADENDESWIKLDTKNDIYNLLELTNGADVLLAQSELPAGKISQIRLVLGENNTLKTGGKEVPLTTPSAQQSGLKLQINADIEAGKNYTVLLDFDAARSVVKAGNSGKYNLKPVIRAIVELQKGVIEGKITLKGSQTAVFAIAGQDTVGTYTDETGAFKIQGLEAGTYDLMFESKDTQKTMEDIAVELGEVKNLGEIIFP